MGNGLHGDFDRGYFSAWADCMRILTRMDIAPQNGNAKPSEPRKNRNTAKRQKPSYNRKFLPERPRIKSSNKELSVDFEQRKEQDEEW